MDELRGKRILIVEDDYFLADEISDAVARSGGIVFGPLASVKGALEALAQTTGQPDAATLNIRVADGDSYPVADELSRLGIPFLFASANSARSLPRRFRPRALLAKPLSVQQLVQALAVLLN